MDKNILVTGEIVEHVTGEIVEHVTLMQISGHLRVKLLEDQV